MTDAYDLIAIGSGPAGESAAELAAFFGHRAAVIEKARPGGTVTTTGGAPTKTLREAALYFSGFREGDVYGLRLAVPPEIATDLIRKRTWSVCEQLQKLTAENIASNAVDYIQGTARFNSDRTLAIAESDGCERTVRAKVILIATGSRPSRPKNISFDIEGVCDTDTILFRGHPPKNILIAGGGAVGVEFATSCHALGADVTIAERGSRLLTMMDGEISNHVSALFNEWSVPVLFGCTVDNVSARNDVIEISLSTGEKRTADTVLFAACRVANTDILRLDAVGVAVDPRRRIVVDQHLRTNAKGICAAGDVLGLTLASIAKEQGRAAICHAFGISFGGTIDPTPVSAVY